MVRTSSVVCTALVLLAGCADNSSGPAVVGTPVAARDDWKPIWGDMQACTGIRGDFARLHLYRSADGTVNGEALGAWAAPHNIYLVDYVFETDFTVIVLHEMIHDLIGVSDPQHLNPLWKKCDPNYAFIVDRPR